MRMRKMLRTDTSQYLNYSADKQVQYIIEYWDDMFPSTVEVSDETKADVFFDYYRELREYNDWCFAHDFESYWLVTNT